MLLFFSFLFLKNTEKKSINDRDKLFDIIYMSFLAILSACIFAFLLELINVLDHIIIFVGA